MKTLLYGVTDSAALIYVGSQKVVVNTQTLSAETVDEGADVIEFAVAWEAPRPGDPVRVWEEIASNSLSQTVKDTEDVAVLSASANVSRAYTVPTRVVANARGVSPSARLTPTADWMRARLASGRQVSLQTLAYMERFFDAHAADRIEDPVWNAWGGNAGRNWVRSTFAKIDTITASVPETVNLSAFSDSAEDAHTFWAEQSHELTAQVVALYQLTPAGTWLAWGDGDWINCEPPEQDRLVQLDDETAIYVAGALFDAPETAVDLRNLDPEEWDLAADGYAGTDWEMVDLVAAAPAPNMTPGQYTPEERSKNASAQLRDANGRFASVGDTGAMQSGVGGTIERVDQSTGNLVVVDANNNRYLVPANSFKVGATGTAEPPKPSGAPDPVTGTPGSELPPLDLNEILAEPRVTDTTPKAWMKKLLQPMSAAQLNKVVDNYSQFIHDERQKRGHDFQPNGGFLDPSDPHPHRTEKIEDHLRKSIHEHERAAKRLYDQLDHPHSHGHGVASDDGFTAAGGLNAAELAEPEMVPRPNPDKTDVPALHLAIVDKDDPRAVTDLCALVPSSAGNNTPALFRRVAGSWVEDVKLLSDIRSPTPPAVVKLTDADYQDVLRQVDSAEPDDSGKSTDPSPTPGAQAAPPPAAAAPPPAPVAASGVPPEPDTVEYVAVWDNAGLPVHLVAAFTAAGEGGLDRNRGGAEKLRRYWLYGPGALKIRWNTPGDWTRCVRHLEKYLGPRAKGYCQLRHHEATGMWTGDTVHVKGFSYTPGGDQYLTTDYIKCHDDIILTAAAKARRELAIAQVKGTMNSPDGPTLLGRDDAAQAGGGKEFTIPLVIPEGVESGDGRTFDKGALTMRDLPLPLMWQFQTGDGHDGSVLVGRIDHVERTADGLGNGRGVFDTGPYGKEAQRLVENGMLRWVSADLDKFEAEQAHPAIGEDDEAADGPPKMGAAKMNISKGRLMGITLVPKPAFQEALIALASTEDEVSVEDGTYVGDPVVSEAEQIVASAGISEAIPVEPPSLWFERPLLNGVTPVTVTNEGQVFGHIATWDMDHIGLPRATRAPRSASNYAYFHTGALRCAEGSDVHVGQLTLAGGHADMLADASSAVRHYDDTGSAIADVHVGEDSYGIWCAGALRPGISPEQIRALRASSPSGDWRQINGRLELVAICQVNVPGFPVPRAQVASGAVCALVAAGTGVLSKLRVAPIDELDIRLQDLERREIERATLRAAAVHERMEPILQQQAAERATALVAAAAKQAEMETLAAAARTRVYKVLDIDGYLTEFKDFSEDKRKALAKDKKALPDGSFPIENPADLRRAVHAYGRASEDKKARVRRHITRRARALDKPDMIPDDWSENALNDLALSKMDAQDVITASLVARAESLRARVSTFQTGESVWTGDEAVLAIEEDPTAEFNWVEKVGGLPKYIKRISKHLQEKGMDQGHAIATAVNAVKKACATGDLNYPGIQHENAGSRAEACADVAEWEEKKARAHSVSSPNSELEVGADGSEA